jgi:hypothetical protein
LGFAGPDKTGIRSRHELLNVALPGETKDLPHVLKENAFPADESIADLFMVDLANSRVFEA